MKLTAWTKARLDAWIADQPALSVPGSAQAFVQVAEAPTPTGRVVYGFSAPRESEGKLYLPVVALAFQGEELLDVRLEEAFLGANDDRSLPDDDEVPLDREIATYVQQGTPRLDDVDRPLAVPFAPPVLFIELVYLWRTSGPPPELRLPDVRSPEIPRVLTTTELAEYDKDSVTYSHGLAFEQFRVLISTAYADPRLKLHRVDDPIPTHDVIWLDAHAGTCLTDRGMEDVEALCHWLRESCALLPDDALWVRVLDEAFGEEEEEEELEVLLDCPMTEFLRFNLCGVVVFDPRLQGGVAAPIAPQREDAALDAFLARFVRAD